MNRRRGTIPLLVAVILAAGAALAILVASGTAPMLEGAGARVGIEVFDPIVWVDANASRVFVELVIYNPSTTPATITTVTVYGANGTLVFGDAGARDGLPAIYLDTLAETLPITLGPGGRVDLSGYHDVPPGTDIEPTTVIVEYRVGDESFLSVARISVNNWDQPTDPWREPVPVTPPPAVDLPEPPTIVVEYEVLKSAPVNILPVTLTSADVPEWVWRTLTGNFAVTVNGVAASFYLAHFDPTSHYLLGYVTLPEPPEPGTINVTLRPIPSKAATVYEAGIYDLILDPQLYTYYPGTIVQDPGFILLPTEGVNVTASSELGFYAYATNTMDLGYRVHIAQPVDTVVIGHVHDYGDVYNYVADRVPYRPLSVYGVKAILDYAITAMAVSGDIYRIEIAYVQYTGWRYYYIYNYDPIDAYFYTPNSIYNTYIYLEVWKNGELVDVYLVSGAADTFYIAIGAQAILEDTGALPFGYITVGTQALTEVDNVLPGHIHFVRSVDGPFTHVTVDVLGYYGIAYWDGAYGSYYGSVKLDTFSYDIILGIVGASPAVHGDWYHVVAVYTG